MNLDKLFIILDLENMNDLKKMPVGIIFAKQDYLVNVLFLNKKYFLERNTFFLLFTNYSYSNIIQSFAKNLVRFKTFSIWISTSFIVFVMFGSYLYIQLWNEQSSSTRQLGKCLWMRYLITIGRWQLSQELLK